MAPSFSQLAVVAAASLPALALAFSPASLGQVSLRSTSLRSATCQHIAAPRVARAPLGLRMQADEAAAAEAPTAAAVVAEESTSEEIALKKTSIAKSKPAAAGGARTGAPRGDKKNKKPLSEYTLGSTVEGKVINIMPYGAFVDIGATTDGLVHVSQIADEFVSDISTVIKVGDTVQVRITEISAETNKVSLSMRSQNAPAKAGGGGQRQGGGGSKDLPEQFRNFDDKEFIVGKVQSVMDYGAFVSIAEGVDGLVHVSQMSEENNIVVEKFVKVGQEVKVRIVSYDKGKKRLSLSMKEWTEAAARDESEDIKGHVDELGEDYKTSFQLAWEKAQAVAK
ncbi:hypothetical protein T484DRAFT_1895471 [Baffinella frigidus]|nr:hypothetical protein T484DRAFT_1895471 [Cryptophyta sp. CCMP2293]